MNLSATLNKSSTAVRARHPQLAEFVRQHALQRGQFTLSSGMTSSYYLDCKQVSFSPEGMSLIVEAIFDEIKDLDIDAVGGMDMGATPIVGAVSVRACQINKALKMFVVRKKAKEHGKRKTIEGTLESPCKVVIIDDVVTTGGSILKAIEEVRKENNQVVLAISVVDRNAGAAEILKEKGIPFQPLVTLSDLGVDDG